MGFGMTQEDAVAAIQRAVADTSPVPEIGPGNGALATAADAYRVCWDCAASAEASIPPRAQEMHGEVRVYGDRPGL
jgi:hypothetical protein